MTDSVSVELTPFSIANMHHKQTAPQQRKKVYRQTYGPEQIKKAYEIWNEGKASIYKAAKLCGIPQQTLRDRTTGIVNPTKFTSGRDSFVTADEEVALVTYVKKVAACGFGYTRNALAELSAETTFFERRRNTNARLSNKWVYRFLLRWPELKMKEHKKYPMGRAPSATQETVENYYKELYHVLLKNGLLEKPHCIYSLIEMKVSEIVSSKTPTTKCRKSSATAPQQTVPMTVIGCVNAAGEALPPYFIFKGKRKSKDLINGPLPDTAFVMSESGCLNSQILQKYIAKHYTMSIQNGRKERTLLLYDGHNTHFPVPLIDWAEKHNIAMFLLPCHTPLLQSLEADTLGPFEVAYHNECSKFAAQNPGRNSHQDTSSLVANAYRCAMTPENITHGFWRAGIFPVPRTLDIHEQLSDDKVIVVKQQMPDEPCSRDYGNSSLLQPNIAVKSEKDVKYLATSTCLTSFLSV